MKFRYEISVSIFACIFGALSKPISWFVARSLISKWECEFVSAEWISKITQAGCDAATQSIEWVVHYPILYLFYYFNLWLFLGAMTALVVNMITEHIVGVPKYLSWMEKLLDILGPTKTFFISTIISGIICWLTPLNEWYYELYKMIN